MEGSGDGGRRRICVVGAGASGLPAIKACLEAGAEVVCFERTADLGGLWNYRSNLGSGQGTVMRSTIINTSKEMMAYSDFPPPSHLPNFMHNSVLNGYLHSYAEHFGLVEHIRFRTEVTWVGRAMDFEESGDLRVRYRPSPAVSDHSGASSDTELITKSLVDWDDGGEEVEEVFQGLMICTGHHATPHLPQLPGQEDFPGRVRHSRDYRDPVGMEGKRVLVVGLGNSAIDAAVELSRGVASEVLLSTRRGAWIWNRVSAFGFPHDIWFMSRFKQLQKQLFGEHLASAYVQHKLNARFDHDMYGLRPDHGFFNAHPAVNDLLPNCLCSGQIKLKGDVAGLEPNGSVLFADGSRSEAVDEVILATGYTISLPYLDPSLLDVSENRLPLYKFVFPVQLPHPSIALIGFIQPIGAIQPIAELQARWAARVMMGKASLPSKEAMAADVAATDEALRRRYYASPRHTVQVDYVPFMDELAELIGAAPFKLSLLRTDPGLWWRLAVGPSTPYSFRLVGPNAWAGARAAVMSVEERVRAPLAREASALRRRFQRRPSGLGIFHPLTALRNLLLLLLGAVGVGTVLGGSGWALSGALLFILLCLLSLALFDIVFDVSTLL